MPNEGTYGGKISVRKNGAVVWQVAAREFPKDRDTDGLLEYAIRIATSDRNSFSSRDGKCMVTVDVGTSGLNVDGAGSDRAKFLIVSGYETPDTLYDSVVVGKSYFITHGRYVPLLEPSAEGSPDDDTGRRVEPSICNEPQWDQLPDDPEQIPTTYDLSIRYDDYDLERAGLRSDMDPDHFEVCYQNFVSLRDIYRHYSCKDRSLVTHIRQKEDAPQEAKELVIDKFEMTPDSLQIALIWSKTYRHLEKLGIKRDLLDDIGELMRMSTQSHDEHQGEAGGEIEKQVAPDVVFSRWLSVVNTKEGKAEKPVNHANDQLSPDPLEITTQDLAAIPGKPLISAAVDAVPGSRTITLRGVEFPGTFVLMYQGDTARYDQHERAS